MLHTVLTAPTRLSYADTLVFLFYSFSIYIQFYGFMMCQTALIGWISDQFFLDVISQSIENMQNSPVW